MAKSTTMKPQPKPQPDIPHIKELSTSLKLLVGLLDHYENTIKRSTSEKSKESFIDHLLEQTNALKKKVNELDQEVQKL